MSNFQIYLTRFETQQSFKQIDYKLLPTNKWTAQVPGWGTTTLLQRKILESHPDCKSVKPVSGFQQMMYGFRMDVKCGHGKGGHVKIFNNELQALLENPGKMYIANDVKLNCTLCNEKRVTKYFESFWVIIIPIIVGIVLAAIFSLEFN